MTAKEMMLTLLRYGVCVSESESGEDTLYLV